MKTALIVTLMAAAAAFPAAAAAPAPVKAAPASTTSGGCILQYEAIIDGESLFDSATIYSRAYVLAAKDCPAPTDQQQAYATMERNGGPQGVAPGTGPRAELGKTMAITYGKWLWGRKFPVRGGEMRDVARMHALPDTPYFRDLLGRRTGASTYFKLIDNPGPATKAIASGEVWTKMAGVCLDYRPANLKPLAVLGGAKCKTWVK